MDGWKEFDDPRFSARGFHHANPDRPGGFAMKGAFLVEQDARLFDHSFFGMTKLEVETMDPSQRKLLEVTYEAIENAGETWESISGSRTGVFVGNFCLDHWMIQSRDWDNPRPYAFVGAGTSILANRISYIFNLQGPSLTIDTACSSSMYALHLAVNAIRAGDCDSAIVASANWIADPGVQIALDKLGALSASSRCHTFDARAEGYARGEGYGAIYLKRPELAIADKSPIRAMIRGSAVNSNGRTGGITRPSASGQEAVIRQAYKHAGDLPFGDTSYFECHGTGTYVGDPIEVAAVGRVFAPVRAAADDGPLLVGSVKSNVGHGEGASALASIMKVVLALERGAIPPIYQLETRNPNIDFDGARVRPVTEVTPWPADRLRRASINSFGYGGANAHCIIDHVNNVLPDYVAPGVFSKAAANGTSNGVANGHATNTNENCHGTNGQHTSNGFEHDQKNGHKKENPQAIIHPHLPIVKQPLATNSTVDAITRQWVLLPLSAHNEKSFELNLASLSKAMDEDHLSLADVAYTLGARRSKLAQRSFCIVDKDKISKDMVADRKPVRAPLQTTNIGFIFTGQGAQWHGMGAQLFEYGVFQAAIGHLDEVLTELSNPPSWTLRSILSGECDSDLIQKAEISQAVCTAVQVGLVDLLASWSILPSGVAGHSSGEIAAAYAAGRITAAEAIVVAYLRGQAVSRNTLKGAMLAVGLGPEEALHYLEGREGEVKVAAINSPGSVTMSGDEEAIDQVAAALTADGVFNRKLKTGGNAYHSHHMLPIGREYVEMLEQGAQRIQQLGLADSDHRYPHVLWSSSATLGKSTDELSHFPSYWRANLESPVRFSEAVEGLVNNDKGITVHALVEIGPHPALKSPLEQILKAAGKTMAYASTLKRNEDGCLSLLQLAGTLFTLNATVDLAAVNAVDGLHGSTCTQLPPYQYTYGDLNYHESRASKEYRYRTTLRHDLLGSKVVGNAKLRPQWRNILRIKDVPWLPDHRLVPDAVLPGAAYLAMTIEAATRIYGEFPEPRFNVDGFSLEDVSIKKSLVIPEDDYGIEVMTSMELVDAATSQSPQWATFSISSVGRNTDEWTEHCTGRVKVEVGGTDEQRQRALDQLHPTASSRAVDAGRWYRKFAEIGLGYGPAFQPLSDINIDQGAQVARATVNLHPVMDVKGGESRYHLHPASLDGAIQLGLIACYGGHAGQADTAFVPVQLSRLYLANDMDTMAGDNCTVVARGERRGVRGANLELTMIGPRGEVLLDVEGLRCISFSGKTKPGQADPAFSSPLTRLVWKPDIRTLSNFQARKLYPPPKSNVDKAPAWGITNKLAHFVVYSMSQQLEQLRQQPGYSPLTGDVGHFFDWVQRKGQTDQSELMIEARRLANQGTHVLTDKIQELANTAPDVLEVQIAKLLHDNTADIFLQRRTGMDVIISADLLTPLYQHGLLMTGIYPQLQHVLAGVAHANPHLRVLEIGGGTGGATRVALNVFQGPNGIKAYRDYTFTDISPGFLAAARESLAGFADMAFSVFDIEQDPVEQGYVEGTYDLIIACQVLHATSNMHRTLTNCRRLLKPGGRLVLVETNRNFIVPGVVVGTFTGYWAGIPDGRVDAPFQELPDWDRSLREAGFSGLDVVLDDFPEPHNTTSVILSTVPEGVVTPKKDRDGSATVHVLYEEGRASTLVDKVCREFEQRGITIKEGSLNDKAVVESITPESRVVAFLDQHHLLAQSGEQELGVFQHVARNAASLVALTSCGTVKGHNPDSALVSGLLRVLQNENPGSRFTSVDIDADEFDLGPESDGVAADLARCIVDHETQLATQRNEDENLEGNPRDSEFVWQDGCMWVSRYVPDAGFHSKHGLDKRSVKPELQPFDMSQDSPVRAAFETPGVINSLYFTPNEGIKTQPLISGYIDVHVAAAGLNGCDLDNWTGRDDRDHLSSEYAGVITAVGPGVEGFQVGDRVCGLGKGQFGNVTRVPASLAIKLGPGDDIVGLASIPLAFATAVYICDHVACLRKGQSILVQPGARDDGLAVIQLARAKGARVFAMAETDEQFSFLVEEVGMPESDVLLAPWTLSSLQRAAQLVPRGKFDVILSTAGVANRDELGHCLLRVLAPRGCLVELGRLDRDTSPTALTLDSLPHSASFARIDPLAVIFDSDYNSDSDFEPIGPDLIRAVDNYHQHGIIKPIPRITATTVDLPSLTPALGSIGQHAIGKLVVCFDTPHTSPIRVTPPSPTVYFDHEAFYVIAGALGGLGQSLVRWMTDRGARHIALLSRRDISSASQSARDLVSSLTRRGITIKPITCNISDTTQVTHAIQNLTTTNRPIKGIVHAAVSYLDLTFDKLSLSRWNQALSAKVAGTKNLHLATLSLPTPLDFFVMTTSALAVYAFPTQSAYTAANNFQDAFARYRRRLGLAASTVSFSLVREVTEVGTNDLTVDLFERNKTATLDEHEFLAAVELAFLNNETRSDQTEELQWPGQENDPLSAGNLHTYLSPAAILQANPETSSTTIPNWYSDPRISHLMRAYLDAKRHQQSAADDLLQQSDLESAKNTPSAVRKAFEAALQGDSPRAGAVVIAEEAIVRAVAGMLFVEVESVDPDKSVAELGVDSLIAAELRSWFLKALGAGISMLDLLDPGVSIRGRAGGVVDAAMALGEKGGVDGD